MKILLKNIWRKFRQIFEAQPLSLRALCALALALIFIIYYGKNQSDLVASSLGVSVALCFSVALVSIIFAISSIYRKFKNYSDYASFDVKFFSETKNSCPIILPRIKIAPFFYLSIKRVFEPLDKNHKKISLSQTHVLKGNFSAETNNQAIADILEFPHRGEFHQIGLKLTYGDALGLTRMSKFISAPRIFKVYPKSLQIQPIPIMAASAQFGDVEHANLERTGDLFDIREYQPGDSLKRVLWKVFARSGNVVVRHPEPAIVPEGEVAIYVFARPEHDHVASSALSYLKILEDQNIIYSLSCLGSDGSIRKTIEAAEDLIIKSTAGSESDDGESFNLFLENLRAKNFSSRTIIVFAPKEFINSRVSTQISKTLDSLSKNAANNQLEIIFTLAPEAPKILFNTQNNNSETSWLSRIDKRANAINFSNLGDLKKLGGLKTNLPRSNMNFDFNNFKTTIISYADV